MTRVRPPSARLARGLAWVQEVYDAFAAERGQTALARDPVAYVRTYQDPLDRELVALVSALMAFGNVATIRAKLRDLFGRVGSHPARTVHSLGRDGLSELCADFRHRTFRGRDVAALMSAAVEVQTTEGSIYAPLVREFSRTNDLHAALDVFATELRSRAFGPAPTRAQRHLVPDPRGPSACKRLVLLLRWLVRPDDGVDLGMLPLPTSVLPMPLDVHVFRVARALGFTRRATPSWHAAEEVTAALRLLDPNDPVKFDFAICHHEIERRLGRSQPVRRNPRSSRKRPKASHPIAR